MALNIGASGTIKPYAKYNSKADKWFAKGQDGDVEIQRPTFLADFKNIATGWLCFREGQAHVSLIRPSTTWRRTLARISVAALYWQSSARSFSAALPNCPQLPST